MRTKRVVIVWAALLLALLVGLAANMPVSQLWRFIQTPKDLVINGLQGTVFSGRVQQIGHPQLLFTDVSYRLQPFCLVKLAVCYHAQSESDELDLKLEYGLLSRSSRIRDSQFDLDAGVLDAVPGLLVKPSGRFQLNVEELVMTSDQKLDRISALGTG